MIESNGLEGLLKDYFSYNEPRITIVCPFISNSMLESILPSDASENVTVVTSWRKDHLRNRVSHVDLFHLTEERGWTLYIKNNLHLKLYSNNLEDAFMGSANLTGKALLDRPGDNIEGLVYLNNLNLEDQVFIESIISNSKLVTTDVYQVHRDWYEENKQELPEDLPPIPQIANDNKDEFLMSKMPAIWSPNHLWNLLNNSVEPDSEWCEEAAMIHDLALYDAPIGVSEEEFLRQLRDSFFSKPFIELFSKQIDEEGMQFGAAKEWLQNNCTTVPTPYRRELTATVQCLFNWFVELAANEYELIQPNHSQVLRLRSGLGSNVYCQSTAKRLDRSWYIAEPTFPDSGIQYKSCPWCSQLHGSQLIFHAARIYPDSESNRLNSEFGFTPQRRSRSNLDGIQTWCFPCRATPKPTELPKGGYTIDEIDIMIGSKQKIGSKGFK